MNFCPSQVNRPLAMRKEGIQTRKRKPKPPATSHQDKPVAGTSMIALPSMARSTSSDPVVSHLSGIYQSIGQNGTRTVEQTDPHPVRSISSPVTPSSVNLTYQIKGIMPLEHQNFASFQMPFSGSAGHHHHYHPLVSHPHIHSSVIHENNSSKTTGDPGHSAHLAAVTSTAATVSHHQDSGASGHEKNASPGV